MWGKRSAIIVISLILCAFSCADDLDKQARDETNKALKEKRIDARGFTELIGKINNGKAADVIKELKNNEQASKLPIYSDWPRWLGPNRNGSSPEKGLLREWPEDGPKLLWMAQITKGWGSVCISKGQVIVSGAGYNVFCLDAFTGKEIWKYSYKLERKPGPAGWGWCPRDTITATDKYVYHLNEEGQLFCLDRKNGAKIWMRDIDEEYKPSHYDWKGWCMSPLVEDNILFQAIQWQTGTRDEKARYIGIDAETGKNIWEYWENAGQPRFGGADLSQTPPVVKFGEDKCVIVTANSRLFALRLKDGKKVWTQKSGGRAHFQQHITSPQIIGNNILLSPFTEDMKLYEVNWRDPSSDGRLIWKYDGATDCSTPVFDNGYIYTFNEEKSKLMGPYILRCLEVATGKLMWEQKGFEIAESIMLADGLLFIRSKAGLMLVEANPKKYVLKGKVDQDQGNYMGWVMPTLAYGRLFVRMEKTLLCFQAAKSVPSRHEVFSELENNK